MTENIAPPGAADTGPQPFDLREFGPVVAAIAGAATAGEVPEPLQQLLGHLENNGRGRLVSAIRALLAGERDPGNLCKSLDTGESAMVAAILEGIEDPDRLGEALRTPDAGPQPSDPLAALDPQRRQVAAAAALWLIEPEARDHLGDLPAQFKNAGYAALADALQALLDGDRDAQRIGEGLNGEDKRILAAVSWILQDPGRLEAALRP